MFTPQEVSEKVFPKASGLGGGYQMGAVDQFLDSLTEDYTALYKENVTLKAKLKVLAEKVEEYRATEDSMRAALMTAQKMAAKLVQEAQQERDRVVANAIDEAKIERERWERENRAVEQRLVVAQQKLAQFIRNSQELCAKQVQFLSQLPELDVFAEKEDSAHKETVDTIGKGILDSYREKPAIPPVSAAPTAPAVAVDGSAAQVTLQLPDEPAAEPFSLDDTVDMTKVFNLDDLKFGRNYTGD